MVDFEYHTENRENWLNIDTIRIPCQIIYLLNSIYQTILPFNSGHSLS